MIFKALVYDNDDPEGLDRLRLLVPQVTAMEPTDWAWPVLPSATLDVLIPELRDPVWALYESGDQEHPLWLGTWQPSAAVVWTDVDFDNGWVNSSSANPTRYARLSNKTVALEGLLSGGTVGDPAFTLSPVCCPGVDLVLPAVTGAGAFTTVEINSDGTVLSPTATSYRLDGIHFVAGV